MKKLGHRQVEGGGKTPKRARLSRFKDIVNRYPQTFTYAAITVAAISAGALVPADSAKGAGKAGVIGVVSLTCTVLAFLRERYSSGMDKIKKVISDSVAAGGFIAGAVLTFVGEGLAQRAGIGGGVFTAFAATIYTICSPIRSNGEKPTQ